MNLNRCMTFYPKTINEISQLNINSLPDECLNKQLINTHKYLIDKYLKFETIKSDTRRFSSLIKGKTSINANVTNRLRAIAKYTSIYLSISKRDFKYLLNLYKTKLASYNLNDKNYILTYNFQIKYELFNEVIFDSFFYLILAILCILLITIFYLKSILITFIILVCVLFSLLVSYFIYKIVFQIKFFPFINIMSIFLLIGLACDDVFVFYDTWLTGKRKYKLEFDSKNKNTIVDGIDNPIYFIDNSRQQQGNKKIKNKYIDENKAKNTKNLILDDKELFNLLVKILNYTFRHAINSIVVTTITTAAVFLVNLSSNIITIRLFGLFSCLTILIDFIFMLIFIPSILVLYAKHENKLQFFKKIKQFFNRCTAIARFFKKIKFYYQKFFNEYLPFFIIKLRFILLFVFLIIGIISIIWIFYKPGLKLPTTTSFQLFSSKNPLEYYDKYASVLSETNGLFFYQLDTVPYLRLNYIFGINLKQNTYGSIWEPDDITDDDDDDDDDLNRKTSVKEDYIKFDTVNFNPYNEHTQLWLKKFCNSLKYDNKSIDRDDNYDYIPTIELFSRYKICLFDYLIPILTRPCDEPSSMSISMNDAETINNLDDINSICCGQQTFPFNEHLLKYCLSSKTFIEKYLMPNESFFYEKLYYNRTTGLINAIQYQQLTLYTWNLNFKQFEKVFYKIEKFFYKQVKYSLFNLNKCAFFTSDFEFYDLQKSLFDTTIQSFLISLLCVTLIMFIATGNLIITFYSILTILLAISTTIGTLALLNWQLNVIESITIILAIGLSIDFTVHFGINYCTLSMKYASNRLSSQVSSSNSSPSKDITDSSKGLTIANKSLNGDRVTITQQCIQNVGSAVLMASLTTFLAGASMMPSPLLSFQLYGTFLMLVMLFSVTFAFFLFLPLLAIIGPTNNLCQLKWNKLFKFCCVNLKSNFSSKKHKKVDEKAIKTKLNNKKQINNHYIHVKTRRLEFKPPIAASKNVKIFHV